VAINDGKVQIEQDDVRPGRAPIVPLLKKVIEGIFTVYGDAHTMRQLLLVDHLLKKTDVRGVIFYE
jgi:hypothetical protein